MLTRYDRVSIAVLVLQTIMAVLLVIFQPGYTMTVLAMFTAFGILPLLYTYYMWMRRWEEEEALKQTVITNNLIQGTLTTNETRRAMGLPMVELKPDPVIECSYKDEWTNTPEFVGHRQICVLHGYPSKFSPKFGDNRPCMGVEGAQ